MASNADDFPFVSAPQSTLQETSISYILEASSSVSPSEGELFRSTPHDSGSGIEIPSSHVVSMLPHGYTSLGKLISRASSGKPLFLDLVWSMGIPLSSSPLFSNVAIVFQPVVRSIVIIGQMNMSIGSSIPYSPYTITVVPPLSGKSTVSSMSGGQSNPLYVPPVLAGGQPSSGSILGASYHHVQYS